MSEDELRLLVRTGKHTLNQLASIYDVPYGKMYDMAPYLNYHQHRQWYLQTLRRRVRKCTRKFMSDHQIAIRYGYGLQQVRMVRYRYVKRGKYVQGQNAEKANRLVQCLKRYPHMNMTEIAKAANCSRDTVRRYKRLLEA